MHLSMRDIKKRVIATEKTAKITKAMNMVSASKLKVAQRAAEGFRPYMKRIEEIICSLENSGERIDNPLMIPRVVNKTCYILLTSDKGLAGPFNTNIFKMYEEKAKDKNSIVYTLGIKGYFYTKSHKEIKRMNDNIISLPDDVPFENVLGIVDNILKKYIAKEIDEVVLVYNHFVNTVNIVPSTKVILPIGNVSKEDDSKNKKTIASSYEFEGGIDSILNAVLPLYLENLVYGTVLDSKASEHASRMTSMKNATDNAKDVISKLSLAYNRARQAAITLELNDIIGGSNAISGGE
ncbi:MAG: ATP synthase F1 subunit gamma [Bacilli bacterium]